MANSCLVSAESLQHITLPPVRGLFYHASLYKSSLRWLYRHSHSIKCITNLSESQPLNLVKLRLEKLQKFSIPFFTFYFDSTIKFIYKFNSFWTKDRHYLAFCGFKTDFFLAVFIYYFQTVFLCLNKITVARIISTVLRRLMLHVINTAEHDSLRAVSISYFGGIFCCAKKRAFRGSATAPFASRTLPRCYNPLPVQARRKKKVSCTRSLSEVEVTITLYLVVSTPLNHRVGAAVHAVRAVRR